MEKRRPEFRKILIAISLMLFALSSCQGFDHKDLNDSESEEGVSISQRRKTLTPIPDKVATNTPDATVAATQSIVTPTLPAVQPATEVPAPIDTPQNDSILTALQKKALGYNLNRDNYQLWQATAREGDLVKIGQSGYNFAEKLDTGFFVIQFPPEGSASPGPSESLMRRAQSITAPETLEPHQILAEAERARALGKKFVVAPTGARLLRWEDSTLREIAQKSDVFIIQAQRWLVEDTTPNKENFVSRVVMLSEAIRDANPNCKIFIQVGRKAERGGGTADEWIDALGHLYTAAPTSFDGIYLFITYQPTTPDQGFGALKDMVALLRP